MQMSNQHKTILEEAIELTSRDRQQAYGHPANHFARTVAGLNARFLAGTNPLFARPMEPQEWALVMVIDKIVGRGEDTRAIKRDSLVDGAGYLRTCEMVSDKLAERVCQEPFSRCLDCETHNQCARYRKHREKTQATEQHPPAITWISVNDRVPDDCRDVLTFGEYGVNKGCFEPDITDNDQNGWWSSEVKKAAFKSSVTHWAELPGPGVANECAKRE